MAAANRIEPASARSPKWRRASTVNTVAVPVAASAAASWGVSAADTAGNRTL